MTKQEFKIEREHLGRMRINSEDHGFNTIVISGPCQEKKQDWQMVGKIVQVRKNTGMFGSDTILVRLMDGDLVSYENMSFFSVADEYKELYESLFPEEVDERNREYSIQGQYKASGFVVENMEENVSGNVSKSVLISVTKSENND